MASGLHLVCGPLAYRSKDETVSPRVVSQLMWDFIGFNGTGEMRRYTLRYMVAERRFRHILLTPSPEEKLNVARLQDFYRPVSVLRTMLPKGSLTDCFRAMLTDADIARCTLLSINHGRA